MAWRSSGATNAELVNNLASAGILSSQRVMDAFRKTNRLHYVQEKRRAYEDSPSSIGHGATISAPHMHAYAAEALAPFLRMSGSVLDVGSGSGYLAAVFHRMLAAAGADGKVVGIDHIPQLVVQSEQNLAADGLSDALKSDAIRLVCGDGRQGWAQGSPYRVIHVGAAAAEIPSKLVEQLAPGGRMFIPVEDASGPGQHIWQVDKDSEGRVTQQEVMGVMYVPLTDRAKQR